MQYVKRLVIAVLTSLVVLVCSSVMAVDSEENSEGVLETTDVDAALSDAELPASHCLEDCVEIGRWRVDVAMGLGVRTNPLVSGDDIPLFIIPELSYYGKRFYLKNLELGFTLFENNHRQVNVTVAPGYQQLYFERWDVNNFQLGGGSTFSAPPVSVSYGDVPYRVNLMASDRRDVSSSGGGSAIAPGNDNSPVDIDTDPESGLPFTLGGVGRVAVNGESLELGEALSYVRGAEGNLIGVELVDNELTLSGLSSSDRVWLERAEDSVGFDLNGPDLSGKESGEVPTVPLDSVEVGFDETGIAAAVPSSAIEAESAPEIEDLRQLSKRRIALLAGLEFMQNMGAVDVHFQALTDVSGLHDGYDIRMAAVLPLESEKSRWALSAGVNYQSETLLDYYYGIDQGELRDGYEYTVDSGGIGGMLRLDWQRSLSDHWSLRGSVQHNALPDTIASSPLIQSNSSSTVFIGGVYHF